MLILLVLWNSCGNGLETGKPRQPSNSAADQNLISLRHCGYADVEKENDRLPSLPCYETTEDVVAACKALYPYMNSTAVRPLAERETRLGALVTFECLQEAANEYLRVPPVLLVPSGCKFKHLQNNNGLCFSQRDWVKLAFAECGLDNLTISQHALLDACPDGLSKGIEFVCCSLDAKPGAAVIQGYDFSDEDGSDESSYGIEHHRSGGRFVEPPQPVMIGDLRFDRDHLDHNWIAAAFDSPAESESKDDFVDSFEEAGKFSVNQWIQSSEESGEFDLSSPALSVEQDRIQTALYKFLYSDLSLMTSVQRQKTIKLVENMLQPNAVPSKQFGKPNGSREAAINDARFLIEYGQLSVRHAVKMLDRICRKTMREGERTNGPIMSWPKKDKHGQLAHKYLRLLQMLYKLQTLIVTLLKSYEGWSSDGSEEMDLRETLRHTQHDVANVLSTTTRTAQDGDAWSVVAQTAGMLKNSFSSSTKQASALLAKGKQIGHEGTENWRETKLGQLPVSLERNRNDLFPLLRTDHDFGTILPVLILLSVLISVVVAVAVLTKHFYARHLSKQRVNGGGTSPFKQVQSAVDRLCKLNRGGGGYSEPRYQKVNDYEVV